MGTISSVTMPARPVDLLVRHAYLITLDDDDTIVADGAVAIEGRRIVAVGRTPKSQRPSRQIASSTRAARRSIPD